MPMAVMATPKEVGRRGKWGSLRSVGLSALSRGLATPWMESDERLDELRAEHHRPMHSMEYAFAMVDLAGPSQMTPRLLSAIADLLRALGTTLSEAVH